MKRLTILGLLILTTAITAFGQQQLPSDQQAFVQGTMAAQRQKLINFTRQQLANGVISKTAADPIIQDSANYIQQLKTRWTRTRYQANFEKGFNEEMARPTEFPQAEPEPDLQMVLRLFAKNILFKLVLVISGLYISRRLWKTRVPKPQKLQADSEFKVELSPEENSKLAAAKSHFDNAISAIGYRENEIAAKITRQAGRAGALLQHVSEVKDNALLDAISELDKTIPKFQAYIDDIESRQPAGLASWASKAWDSFLKNPKPEFLHIARIAEYDEENRWSWETGIRIPWLIHLFKAKGPIVVKCTPANRQLARTIIQGLLTRAALASPADVSFSLVDPESLGSGFPISKYLPKVRPSTPNPGDQIREIVEDIRRINTNVVAHAESFAALPPEKRGGEMFELVAVLDYPAAYKQDSRTATDLARIAQVGPRAGRHLMLEWVAPQGDTAAKPPGMDTVSDIVLIDTAIASDTLRFDPLPEAERLQQLLSAATAKKAQAPVKADWNSQVRPPKFFTFSSAQMIETPVGDGLRIWFGDNPDGRPCAHGMLAGQTGSGKSFLLHVIITGLAARYSPDELRFVLVDGKQGVEFEAYRTLPHAQVVCLQTSPSIARSVLKDIIAEMDVRFETFKRVGVTKLEDYRTRTGTVMPRMLMVVDEFQQLLEGDPEQGATMLTLVMEKGRAAGIHLLLGSQTFEARGFPSSTMAHVHLRAALSLPVDYIQTMTALAADGKKLVRDLASSGQVVINDQGGRDNANTKGAVTRLAAASGSGLASVVSEITTAAASPLQPIVLSGNDAAVLRDNPFVWQWKSSPPDAALLQATARRLVREGGFGITSWNAADHTLPFWLGRKFDVHGHLLAPLRRAPGQNLLVLGSDSGVRLMMLAHALAALRSMREMKGCDVLLLDGFSSDQPGAGMLKVGLDVLAKDGARVECAGPTAASAALERFASLALQPKEPEAVRLLVISEPEYFPDLAAPSSYGAPVAGPAKTLKELLRAGPPLGCHAVVTASGLASLASILHPSRDAALFNHRVVQQSNEEESMTLFSSMAATRIMAQTGHFMAGMYVDNVQGVRAAQLFKAYAANPDIYADQSAAAVAAELETLFGGKA